MILLSRFVTSKEQDEQVQCSKPEVPVFWNGYYAVFPPKQKGDFWKKFWFASDSGKTIKNAAVIMKVEKAHEYWNNFLNNAKNINK